MGFAQRGKKVGGWVLHLLIMRYRRALADGALKPAFASGPEYAKWVEENEGLHKRLMAQGGLLQK